MARVESFFETCPPRVFCLEVAFAGPPPQLSRATRSLRRAAYWTPPPATSDPTRVISSTGEYYFSQDVGSQLEPPNTEELLLLEWLNEQL